MVNRSAWPRARLTGYAVYWTAPNADGLGGRTFVTPTEIRVRWEDREVQFVDPDGEEQVSEAVVFTASQLEVGGYLWNGLLADLSAGEMADPFSKAGTKQIRGRRGIDNLSGTQTLHTAFLRRGILT